MSRKYNISISTEFDMDPVTQASKVIELLEENPETKKIIKNCVSMSPNEFMTLLQYLSDLNALDFTTFVALCITYQEIVEKRTSVSKKISKLNGIKDHISYNTYEKILEEILNGN